MPPRKTTTPRSRKKKITVETEPTLSSVLEEVSVTPQSSSVPIPSYRLDQPEFRPGEFYPTPKFYKTIALSFLSLAVLLILGVFYFTLGKAEINLSLKPKNIKTDFLVTVSNKINTPNNLTGVVAQTVLKREKNFPVKLEGEGVIGIPNQASGKVIIYNNTNRAQTLVATTRLLTPENILFRMKRTLVVPAQGQIESEVYADLPGLEGEVESTQFSIPGLSLELQKLIFAESKEKMIGGMRFSRKLNEADFKLAQDQLIKELVEEGKSQMIKSNATSSLDAHVFNFEIISVNSDTKVGQEAEFFKVLVEVKLNGIFYTSKDLNKLLSDNLQNSLNDNEIVLGSPSLPNIEFNKLITVGEEAELKISQEATAQISYLEDVIDKNKILGQKKATVEEYFSTLPWLETAEIKLSPSWLRSVPKEMNKVKIKINQ